MLSCVLGCPTCSPVLPITAAAVSPLLLTRLFCYSLLLPIIHTALLSLFLSSPLIAYVLLSITHAASIHTHTRAPFLNISAYVTIHTSTQLLAPTTFLLHEYSAAPLPTVPSLIRSASLFHSHILLSSLTQYLHCHLSSLV